MSKDTELKKAFQDGQEWAEQMLQWKLDAILADEPTDKTTTTVNNERTATSKAEIRNELRAEIRTLWKTTEIKGRLSPALKKVLDSHKETL